MSDAPFYHRDPGGPGRFTATASTRGPWSNAHQHAGPPTALLARFVEALAPSMRLARVTCEMRKPIPIAAVAVEAALERSGRKSALANARLLVDGDVVLTMRALLLREIETPVVDGDAPPAFGGAPFTFDFFSSDVGYHTAIEARVVDGAFGSGRMTCWMRQRRPLVDDEPTSGAQRVLLLADAASGVSAALDTGRFTFANADLSVHLTRSLEGEWLCMRATTTHAGNGGAVAASTIYDPRGRVGHGLQSLVVEPRARDDA